MKNIKIKGLPSEREVACALLLAIDAFNVKKDKTSTRVRITRNVLKEISHREVIKSIFADRLADELEALGWSMFEHESGYALIQKSRVGAWPALSVSAYKEKYKSYTSDEIVAEYDSIYGNDEE